MWSSKGNPVSGEVLAAFIETIGRDLVFVDVPRDLDRNMRTPSEIWCLSMEKISDVNSRKIICPAIITCMFYYYTYHKHSCRRRQTLQVVIVRYHPSRLGKAQYRYNIEKKKF